jgi:hypothetical protein
MEETAAVAGKSGPLTGHAEVLARPSSVDEINVPPWCVAKPPVESSDRAWSVEKAASATPLLVMALLLKQWTVQAEGSDISYPQRMGPVAGEHFEAPRILFDLDERLDARTIEAELEAAGAAEEANGTHVCPS